MTRGREVVSCQAHRTFVT